MKVITCLSTMKQENYRLLSNMNIKSDAVIVNQSQESERVQLDNNIIWINSKSRGLSKSRNKCIKEVSSEDIVLLADDDLVYENNYQKKILDAFKERPNADYIAFRVDGINKVFKKYPNKIKKVGFFRALKVSSVQIAFRKKSLERINVTFNEHFGSGAPYFMGEETIFLYDAIKKGWRGYFLPQKIAGVYIGSSTWFSGYNYDYFYVKGACFAEMSKNFSSLLMIQFALRKIPLYKHDLTFNQALKAMINGRKEYLLNKKQN